MSDDLLLSIFVGAFFGIVGHIIGLWIQNLRP